MDNSVLQQQIMRIAGAFNIQQGVDEIVEQLRYWRPMAAERAKTMGLTSRDAWCNLLQSVQSRREGRSHPYKALHAVVMRFAAATGTTAAVESSFSKQLQGCGKQLDGLCDSHVDDKTEVQSIKENELPDVIKGARSCWSRVYGHARLSGAERQPRLDLGREKTKPENSEKASLNNCCRDNIKNATP